MLRLVVFLAVLVAVVYSETTPAVHTHKPRPSHEPSEHAIFSFVYIPAEHKFAISAGGDCYIFNLTDDERIAVHSDAGIKAMELKFLGLIETAKRTEITKENASRGVLHSCSHHTTHYYLMSQ